MHDVLFVKKNPITFARFAAQVNKIWTMSFYESDSSELSRYIILLIKHSYQQYNFLSYIANMNVLIDKIYMNYCTLFRYVLILRPGTLSKDPLSFPSNVSSQES